MLASYLNEMMVMPSSQVAEIFLKVLARIALIGAIWLYLSCLEEPQE
jgi:hypothetical protein